jgi:hypothetical protein
VVLHAYETARGADLLQAAFTAKPQGRQGVPQSCDREGTLRR